MRDRRKELGLDPDGLREKYCSECGQIVEVRTVREPDGTKHYTCREGHSLGSEAAGSFDPPRYLD